MPWSAATPESPPEQVRTARPPGPRGRAAGAPSARASSSRSWKSSAQAPPASSTRARKTRWSPASEPVWAAAARAPASEAPTLSTATPIPRSAQTRERLGERRAVVVGLQEERHRSQPVALGQRRQPVARRADRLVAGRDHRVPADPASGAERVDADVAALRDHRRPRPARGRAGRRPTLRPGAPRATIPFPFGPQTGRSCARATLTSSAWCSRPDSTSANPAESTTAPPHPRSAPARTAAATPRPGSRRRPRRPVRAGRRRSARTRGRAPSRGWG